MRCPCPHDGKAMYATNTDVQVAINTTATACQITPRDLGLPILHVFYAFISVVGVILTLRFIERFVSGCKFHADDGVLLGASVSVVFSTLRVDADLIQLIGLASAVSCIIGCRKHQSSISSRTN